MSKMGRIFLTLLAAVMFGLLIWKLFPMSIIKLNLHGFILMLIGMGLFYFSTWKASAKEQRSLMDNISLWLLIVLLVSLFPGFLIALRISWFFNTIPQFGILFLSAGMGLIFCVLLIHKLLGRFFTNGLWILDAIHLTAPFWMPAIAPLTISLGSDLKLPKLFTWTSTYVYYGIVVLFILFAEFVHQKRGNPSPLLIGSKFYPIERMGLKIMFIILMGLFVFISSELMLKYSAEIENLLQAQKLGLTVVDGYDFRIRMAKNIFFLCNVCSAIAVIMIIWSLFTKEIATAHTQLSLVLLPLLGSAVVLQSLLFLSEKVASFLFLLNSGLQHVPSFKNGYYFLYALYALIVFVAYILVRGLLLPESAPKKEDSLLDG